MISLFQFCKKSQKQEANEEDDGTIAKVVDVEWKGDPASIPALMKNANPIASQSAIKGGAIKIFSHQFPKSLNYYLEQFSTTAQIFTKMFEPLVSYHPITLDTIPHLAREWKISPDKKTFTFYLDKNAVWSDGKNVTAHDVLFTYNTLMDKNNNTPIARIGLSRFQIPKVIDDYTIEFTAKDTHWNNFDEIASGLFILPKHAMEGKEFNKINFEFPVTSGPYKLTDVKKGRYVKMVRRGDYWQRTYPFNRGKFNFDAIYYKVYNQEPIAFQAFKKGDIDFFPVYTASLWIKDAIGDKFDNNYIVKQRVYNKKPIGFQGWTMNSRREIFKDKRVRKAMAHLVDRKLLIEKIMFSEYQTTDSYYPDYYLGEESNPNVPIQFDLSEAKKLLADAGWKPNSKGILEKDGKEFQFTILDRDKRSEKFFTIFIEKAKEIGINAKLETTDLAAWSERVDKFDFDMTWASWGSGIFKDPESLWHSKYAEEKGSHNLPAFKNIDVDKLIDAQKIEFNVAERDKIVKKIDQIIYNEFPYILLWHIDNTRILYWNKFSFPEIPLGKYGAENYALDYWWYDSNKKNELDKNMKENKPMPAYSKEIRWKD